MWWDIGMWAELYPQQCCLFETKSNRKENKLFGHRPLKAIGSYKVKSFGCLQWVQEKGIYNNIYETWALKWILATTEKNPAVVHSQWNGCISLGYMLDPSQRSVIILNRRKSCGWPIPEGAQGRVGWGPGQPDLVPSSVVGIPAHSRGVGNKWSLRSPSIKKFYDMILSYVIQNIF